MVQEYAVRTMIQSYLRPGHDEILGPQKFLSTTDPSTSDVDVVPKGVRESITWFKVCRPR